MSLNFVFLSDDVMKLVIYYLGKFGSFMLYLTSKRFRYVAKYDRRLITFRQAMLFKSYGYIMFVQNMKNKTINIDKHYYKILDTQDLSIIKMFFSKNYITHIKTSPLFEKQVNKLLIDSSPEIVNYVFDGNFSDENLDIILQNKRIDILNYYMQNKKINIVAKKSISRSVLRLTSSDVIMYLCNMGMKIPKCCLFSILKSDNIDHIKWGFNTFGENAFIRYISVLLKCEYFISKILVHWLYSNNIVIPIITYTDEVMNELNNKTRNETMDDILNKEKLSANVELDIPIYIIEKKDDIYELSLLSNNKLKDENKALYIRRPGDILISNNKMYNYKQCHDFLKKYFDIITNSNVTEPSVFDFILDKIDHNNNSDQGCEKIISLAIEYYKKGVKCFLYKFIRQLKKHKYSYHFDKKIFIYIVEEDDMDLIKIAWDLGNNADYLVKYCSLKSILKLFSMENITCFPKNVIDAIVFRGSIRVFRWYMIYGKLRPIHMYIGIMRFPELENDILSLKCVKEFGLIDYVEACGKDKEVYSIIIDEEKKDICFNKLRYCYMISKMNVAICDESINKIICKDNVFFYDFIITYTGVLPKHIRLAIISESISILTHICVTNKFIFPFCKTECKNRYSTVTDICSSILNSGCDNCRDIILDLIENEKIGIMKKVSHLCMDTYDQFAICNAVDICGKSQIDYNRQYRVYEKGDKIKVSLIEHNFNAVHVLNDDNDVYDKFDYSLSECSDNDLCQYDESEECNYDDFLDDQ